MSGERELTEAELEALLAAVEARSGVEVDEDWLVVAADEVLTFVRLLAPCKRNEWTSISALPSDVQSVVVSALARMASNPRGIRQETIGEYSYTLAGVNAAGGVGTGPFSPSEARVITAVAGCGGGFKSVPMVVPAPLRIDAPESAPYGDLLGHWEEPSHANGFRRTWVPGGAKHG
jgi:hypothetical protein